METLLAIVVGVLFTSGVYMVLRRNLLRVVFGIALLTNGVNLLLFTSGRFLPGHPPLIPEGMMEPAGPVANPLPQALILTAIVIGFGLLAFTLVLVLRAYLTLGSMQPDHLDEDETGKAA